MAYHENTGKNWFWGIFCQHNFIKKELKKKKKQNCRLLFFLETCDACFIFTTGTRSLKTLNDFIKAEKMYSSKNSVSIKETKPMNEFNTITEIKKK